MTQSTADIAREALDRAKTAEASIDAHEDICAERYRAINATLSFYGKALAWAGSSAFLIVMGLLAFLAKTQFDSMKTNQDAALRRVEAPPPQIVIQRAEGGPEIGATVERHTAYR